MSCCGPPSGPRKRPSRTVAVLLSCCIFLLIVCACLLAALVFVGKHILYNHPSASHPSTSRNVPVKNADLAPVAQRRFSRLPDDTRPVLYDLTLLPDLSKGEFKGAVNITVVVAGYRKELVVHSKGLFISHVSVARGDGTVLRVVDVDESLVDEVVIVTTRERISPGVYHLYIKFGGSLKERLTGFYQSQYRTTLGSYRYLICSSVIEKGNFFMIQ